jgi:hypothetical protein
MAVEVDQSIFCRVLLDFTDSLDDWDFVSASFDIWDVRALLDGFDSTKPGPRGGHHRLTRLHKPDCSFPASNNL